MNLTLWSAYCSRCFCSYAVDSATMHSASGIVYIKTSIHREREEDRYRECLSTDTGRSRTYMHVSIANISTVQWFRIFVNVCPFLWYLYCYCGKNVTFNFVSNHNSFEQIKESGYLVSSPYFFFLRSLLFASTVSLFPFHLSKCYTV